MNGNNHVMNKIFACILIVIARLRFANESFPPTFYSLLLGICKQLALQQGADFLSLHNVSANGTLSISQSRFRNTDT